MDDNVKKSQIYLNAMFGGHADWVELKEDGVTGTATMQGIIRAFQIQNNVEKVTGEVGKLTVTAMKNLSPIVKMEATDTPLVNVCLLQCALFCKGYAAGGITGIYYTSGVAAVKQMQSDAGLNVTGTVDWKVWHGLLSLNWFTLVDSGTEKIAKMQKLINSRWSDVVGVGPCDGVVSRYTALSLVGALQAEEGVTKTLIYDLNMVNFGNATTSNFPDSLKENQNTSAYIGYNLIAQFGLFMNGYEVDDFDGLFTAQMKNMVSEFQFKYGLLNIGLVTEGEVNVSTMKSLLTSKGDTSRTAKACDCATILNSQQAKDLVAAGYTHVGRYLTGGIGSGETYASKAMTLDEIKNISSAGLSVFVIYQDGGYYLDYFKDSTQGLVDAETAILAAQRIGIPSGTTIYFAVDFDCYGYQIGKFIIPYFSNIKRVFCGDKNSLDYKIGIYAPRFVCALVSSFGLAEYSFVADMSTGFSCNLGFAIPDNWAFDQFYEFEFNSSPTFDLDKDGYSARDKGVSAFDIVEEKTEEEIERENLEARLDIERNQYILNVFDSLGFIENNVSFSYKYDETMELTTYSTADYTIYCSATLSKKAKLLPQYDNYVTISIDNSGKLSESTTTQIDNIVLNCNVDSASQGTIGDIFKNIALSVKSGNISVSVSSVSASTVKFSVCVSTDNLMPEHTDIESAISVTLDLTIVLHPSSTDSFSAEKIDELEFAFAAAMTFGAFSFCLVSGGMSMFSFILAIV